MLLRLEAVGEFRRRAEAADLDVVVLVLAIRRIGRGQVGDGGQLIVEHHARRLLRRLQLGHRELQLGDFVLEGFGDRRVLARHCGADLLRRGVSPLLRLLQFDDRGAAPIVEREQRLGARGEGTPRHSFIECFGIFTNRFDIVHRVTREVATNGAAAGRRRH